METDGKAAGRNFRNVPNHVLGKNYTSFVNPSIYNIIMRSHQGAAGLSAKAIIKQSAHVSDDY